MRSAIIATYMYSIYNGLCSVAHTSGSCITSYSQYTWPIYLWLFSLHWLLIQFSFSTHLLPSSLSSCCNFLFLTSHGRSNLLQLFFYSNFLCHQHSSPNFLCQHSLSSYGGSFSHQNSPFSCGGSFICCQYSCTFLQ